MADEPDSLADSIHSGRYFQQARSWYQALYIGPVSERSFFLLIAVMAGLVALIALMALGSLLPLSSRPAFVIASKPGKIDDVVPRVTKLRPAKGDVNEALATFFVQQYVASRESYVEKSFAVDSAFVKGQSSTSVYDAYRASIASKNAGGKREVVINNVDLKPKAGGGKATLSFTDSVIDGTVEKKSRWTAKLDYTYTEMVVESVTNPDTGEEELNIKDPQFQVTSYAVEKNN